MNDSSNRFRTFAARLLEHEGALVDFIEPEGLEAMLPDPLQRDWRAPEFLRLGFAAELPAGAERASLESDWLERFSRLLGARGQRLTFVAGVGLPPLGNVERMVEHTVTLQNAVYRIAQAEAAWTRYLLFVFRYTAISDEKREGIVRFGFNLANAGACDAFADQLLAATLDPEVAEAAVKPAMAQLPADWSAERMKRAVARALPHHVRGHLGPFVQGMQRRLDRDLARVHEYYSGLREEAHRKLKKAKSDSAREQLRIEAAEREYQAKVADLKQKYDLRVNLELVQTLDFVCPVHRVMLVVKRRKGERKLSLDWNPIARMLDSPPCEWSFAAGGPRVVCDDQLHLVRPEGHAPCIACGREYCRVCAPRRCPKCGRESTENDDTYAGAG
jgi:plasmid maintenance system killer protein